MNGLAILLLGSAFAGAGGALMHMTGIAYQRGTWVVTMVAIALFYVVFAVENGGPVEAALHAAIALAFIAMAILGGRGNPWWIVAALAGHGVFDAGAPLFVADPSPLWWGPFCLGVDLTLAAWLAVLLKTRTAEW